jgi:hypothetical protein
VAATITLTAGEVLSANQAQQVAAFPTRAVHARSREARRAALMPRCFRLVLDAAPHAAGSNDTAIDCVRDFTDRTIDQVLQRGRRDGSIRPDVTAVDIIVFGALLAQPLPHIPNRKVTARRRAAIHVDGLAGAATTATEQ